MSQNWKKSALIILHQWILLRVLTNKVCTIVWVIIMPLVPKIYRNSIKKTLNAVFSECDFWRLRHFLDWTVDPFKLIFAEIVHFTSLRKAKIFRKPGLFVKIMESFCVETILRLREVWTSFKSDLNKQDWAEFTVIRQLQRVRIWDQVDEIPRALHTQCLPTLGYVRHYELGLLLYPAG